ncbi:MAG: prephenate dehydrogenase [Oscillospiraceae bacterium]|nr:prephenate dehydrogenase [Oscillospiraceae bacterium]
MTVGIVGLGLIGGSFAKSYKNAGHTVLALDTDDSILEFAIMSNVVDGKLENDKFKECDLILIALYPTVAIKFLELSAKFMTNPKTTVIDCCGTKKNICIAGFEAAKQYGFTFVGGHPMAGTEQSGFKFSDAELFEGASMIIIPPEDKVNDIEFLNGIKTLLAPAKFGRMTVSNAEEHDKIIAFTSQMAHLVSNSFIKSPVVSGHKGFSAGSYNDLTRVAWLNEEMWTELFMENKDNLLHELDLFITSLREYRTAIMSGSHGKLQDLLAEGKLLKEQVDRRNSGGENS